MNNKQIANFQEFIKYFQIVYRTDFWLQKVVVYDVLAWMSGNCGMMVVNVWLMMRLVMRALIAMMILWRMVMIGHVRIISGLCVMNYV